MGRKMSDLTPFLQTLRDRLSISEVIRPHVKLVRKGRHYSGLCPFHKEKSPSFTVNDEKGFYHCFGCGAHGDIFDFVMNRQNMPFMEAVEQLAHLLGLDVPKRSSSASHGPKPDLPKPDKSLYEVMEAACCWYQQQLTLTQGAFARTCFEQRGLRPETIAQFRLGYAPERGLQAALQTQGFSEELMAQAGLIGHAEERNATYDRFRNRLMFPIWDAKGRVIAFGGRILKEGEPKYLNSPDTPTFTKGRTLYAWHWALPAARQREAEPLVVVEGYMDVIAMHQAGLKSVVAPLGTALTPEQMGLLWRGVADPILCFDGDAAGIQAAHRAVRRALGILKVGKTLRFCFLPSGEDPDSLIRSGRESDLRQSLKTPQPLVEVLWSIFMQGRALSTPDQKAVASKDLGELMKEITDPDVRHFYKEDLQGRLFALTSFKGKPPNRSGQNYGQGYGQRSFFKNSPNSSGMPETFSSSTMPGFLPVARTSPHKNHLGYKILLATLLNHPTLIEDAAESLMLITDATGRYDELRQAVLSIMAEATIFSAGELQDLLRQKGFAALLAEILTPQIYIHAPFARQTSTQEEALAGWKEVWQRTVARRYLVAETGRAAETVRKELTQESWENFRDSKKQEIFEKDEKKGV